MYKDIKDVFAKHLAGTKYDNNLYKKIRDFRVGWATKSGEYIEFLGSNLLGVHEVRFSSRDEGMFFNDVLGIDQNELKADIYSVPGINPSWKVSSNPLYQTIMYIMHQYLVTNNLGKKTEEVVKELYFIFAYKAMSSLISHSFKHAAKESVAKSTYERLTNRYMIKRLGSWQKVFEHRALDFIPPNGLHVKELKKLNTENSILITNDTQVRLRDMFKNIYSVMIDVIDEDKLVTNTSLNTKDNDGDGGGLRDVTEGTDSYVNNVYDVLNKPNDFVKEDVITIISAVLPNVDPDILKKTLYYISNNIKEGTKEDFLKSTIIYNMTYINQKGYNNNYMDNIMDILYLIKSYWNSSRVSEKGIPKTKKLISKIVIKSTNKKTKWLITSLTVAVVMYVFLRALSKKTV